MVMLPHEGGPASQVADHVTDVSGLPVTVCVNCCVCEAVKVPVPGATVIVSGFKVTVAVADLVLSTDEIAVTVTDAVAGTTDGAV